MFSFKKRFLMVWLVCRVKVVLIWGKEDLIMVKYTEQWPVIGLNFVLYWLISNSTGPVWSQDYNLLKSVSWFAHKLSWWQIWFYFPIIIHCKCSYTFKNVFKHVLLSNWKSLKWQLSNWIYVICCNFWSISFTRHNANVPGSISKTCMSS